MKRRVQIERNLFFEYEVAPHRAILARISKVSQRPIERPQAAERSAKAPAIGGPIAFKQIRSIGQINPLKPPLDLETVLIGRALGQEAGYMHGVGFRIRDDGYVEGEFAQGVEKFNSFEELARSIKQRLPSAS